MWGKLLACHENRIGQASSLPHIGSSNPLTLRSAMLPISKMAAAVQPSATIAAGAKARQLKSQGIKVFDFSLGEPDFNTPAHIIAAAHKAMLEGQTHYTPAGGLAEVKSCIARW